MEAITGQFYLAVIVAGPVSVLAAKGNSSAGGGSDWLARKWVAVGTGVAPSPPHRTVRAELPHTAPTSG